MDMQTEQELSFPPAMRGERVDGDPLERAVMQAVRGIDAGLVAWRVTTDRVSAAVVLASSSIKAVSAV